MAKRQAVSVEVDDRPEVEPVDIGIIGGVLLVVVLILGRGRRKLSGVVSSPLGV